jgi:hypothetical protein
VQRRKHRVKKRSKKLFVEAGNWLGYATSGRVGNKKTRDLRV